MRKAVVGDIAAGVTKNQGVAAFVTDGPPHDKAGIVATGLPVFRQGIQPNAPAMNGPGVAGTPVTLEDIHVNPDDVVVGDADGMVVVPADRLQPVLDRFAPVHADRAQTVALVSQRAIMAASAMA
jgi:4-hydroxy-4-methyl-2-oxoglutarate aldolase